MTGAPQSWVVRIIFWSIEGVQDRLDYGSQRRCGHIANGRFIGDCENTGVASEILIFPAPEGPIFSRLRACGSF
jgi:hypothetical protein